MTTKTTQTAAGRQAEAVADWFRSAGWEVDVHHLESPPSRYRDGSGQYTSGRRYTWVSATRPDLWEVGAVRHIHAGWCTITEPMPGRGRTTKFCHVSVNKILKPWLKITSRKQAYALFSSLTSCRPADGEAAS